MPDYHENTAAAEAIDATTGETVGNVVGTPMLGVSADLPSSSRAAEAGSLVAPQFDQETGGLLVREVTPDDSEGVAATEAPEQQLNVMQQILRELQLMRIALCEGLQVEYIAAQESLGGGES